MYPFPGTARLASRRSKRPETSGEDHWGRAPGRNALSFPQTAFERGPFGFLIGFPCMHLTDRPDQIGEMSRAQEFFPAGEGIAMQGLGEVGGAYCQWPEWSEEPARHGAVGAVHAGIAEGSAPGAAAGGGREAQPAAWTGPDRVQSRDRSHLPRSQPLKSFPATLGFSDRAPAGAAGVKLFCDGNGTPMKIVCRPGQQCNQTLAVPVLPAACSFHWGRSR